MPRIILLAVCVFFSHAIALKANSWQARLDKAILSVDIGVGPRLRLLRRAVGDPAAAEDVRKAVAVIQEKGFGKGHPEVIELLYPTGTLARGDIEGLFSLRKTVPEAVQSLSSDAPDLVASASRQPLPPPPNPFEVASALARLATDREQQKELKEEAKNAFRPMPKGLETPKYTVVRTLDGAAFLGRNQTIELRSYAPFTVIKKPMATATGGALFGGAAGGEGFNTLARYLFGGNVQKEAMAMTTPVEISTGAAGASMAFVLPEKNADAPPTPEAGSEVTVAAVPARLVAVKAFPGIVTDEEVARQKEALLDALAADGTVIAVDASALSVLQYNGPQTLPWRRRNEVALVVTEAAAEAAAEEAPVERPLTDEDEADEVVSWYDAGVRL